MRRSACRPPRRGAGRVSCRCPSMRRGGSVPSGCHVGGGSRSRPPRGSPRRHEVRVGGLSGPRGCGGGPPRGSGRRFPPRSTGVIVGGGERGGARRRRLRSPPRPRRGSPSRPSVRSGSVRGRGRGGVNPPWQLRWWGGVWEDSYPSTRTARADDGVAIGGGRTRGVGGAEHKGCRGRVVAVPQPGASESGGVVGGRQAEGAVVFHIVSGSRPSVARGKCNVGGIIPSVRRDDEVPVVATVGPALPVVR